MTKLHIATDLALPVEAVTEAMAFLGRRGSGKSYAAQRLAEEFYRAKAQFVAIDPVGNWHGLRLAKNGEAPGIPIPVFGGLRGDLPLEPTAGALIADVIVDRGISAVVDVSQFESDANKARFARAFCERFYFRKKSAPSAVHVFLEEAQEFVPQNPTKDEPLMLHAFTRLAKLGRNFGIGISLISQRPQEVNKKVLNLAELLFVFQLTGVHERKAVESWISDKGIEGQDIDAELPKLERGKPHAWSPGWLKLSRVVSIHEKWTYDASSTPKLGAHQVEQKPLAPIDLEKLRSDMKDTIERAKADDPKELRKEIAALKSQLAKAAKAVVPVAPVSTDAIESEVRRALATREQTIRTWLDERARSEHRVLKALEQVTISIAGATSDLQKLEGLRVPTLAATPLPAKYVSPPKDAPAVQRHQITAHPEARRQAPPSTANGSLPRGQQRILNALAELEALGVDEPTRAQLGMVAGYNLTGGTGAQHIADLGSLGLVAIPRSGIVQLTDSGRAAADAQGTPTRVAELHERVLAKLSAGQRRIAEHLISIYPDAISRAELGQAVGYNLTGGTGAQHVADLVTVGAARIPQSGRVVASDLLFPAGLT